MRFTYLAMLLFLCFINYVNADTHPVVLISIDGFANEYLDKYSPPNILKLAKKGVRAKALLPVYPSKTFPNHISIVTGMYPANHGIIHNRFYHPRINQNYKLGAGKNNSDWLTAKPIWTMAEQRGIKTGLFFWPESEATIEGVSATYNIPYNGGIPNKTRIDKIIQWLKLHKSEQPQFIASYFSTVDTAGHFYGPESKEVELAIKEVDELIGMLVEKIEAEVKEKVNIVLVSDHGMTLSGKVNAISVADLLKPHSEIKVVNGQTQLYIYSENEQLLNDTRSQLSKQENKFTVYQKGNFPEHWHFNTRLVAIPDLIINATPPYTFYMPGDDYGNATHGYDAKNIRALDAVFIASGPDFKQGLMIEPFENIHIFPMLLQLLNIKSSKKVDGKVEVLSPILISSTH